MLKWTILGVSVILIIFGFTLMWISHAPPESLLPTFQAWAVEQGIPLEKTRGDWQNTVLGRVWLAGGICIFIPMIVLSLMSMDSNDSGPREPPDDNYFYT